MSSGQGVSVIETWCWCTSLPSECDVGVIGVRCQCHRDAVLVLVLVSLGRGVGVEIVDTQGRSVLVTAHSTPPPSQHAPPEYPQAAPKVCEGCHPLHQQ